MDKRASSMSPQAQTKKLSVVAPQAPAKRASTVLGETKKASVVSTQAQVKKPPVALPHAQAKKTSVATSASPAPVKTALAVSPQSQTKKPSDTSEAATAELPAPPAPAEEIIEELPSHLFTAYITDDDPFWPEPGDIIIRTMPEADITTGSQVVSIQGLVELYKDEFFSVKSLTNDQCALRDFNSLLFRPGDHVLRIGGFKFPTWKWEDHKYAELFVYWPGYHARGPWVRVPSVFRIDQGVLARQPPTFPQTNIIPRFPLSFIHNKYSGDEFNWSMGDFLIRTFHLFREYKEEVWDEKTGQTIEEWTQEQERIKKEIEEWNAKNPWKKLYGGGQVQEDWEANYLHIGDLVVRVRAHDGPQYRQVWITRSTRLDVECFLHLGGYKWRNMGGDGFTFDFHRGVRCTKRIRREFPSFSNIPQPGDILLSYDKQFNEFDLSQGLGGYIQLHQNSTDSQKGPEPTDPPWFQSGNPMILRLGRFEHWSLASVEYDEPPWLWFSNQKYELYGRHPSKLGSWMLLATKEKPYPIRPPELFQLEEWEVLEQPYERPESFVNKHANYELNTHIPDFVPQEKDIIIRHDTHVYPFALKNRIVFPWVPRRPMYSGDLLVRFKETPAIRTSGFCWTLTVELYVLTLNDDNEQSFIFRGRDRVYYGESEMIDSNAEELQPKAVTSILSQSNPLCAAPDEIEVLSLDPEML